MNINSYADKVGGFVASNLGTIEDCYAETKIHSKLNVAGFVYENNGKIKSSVTKSKIKAKENAGGFFCKNKGEVINSTWIHRTKKKKESEIIGEQPEEASKNSETTEGAEGAQQTATANPTAETPLFYENEKIKTEFEEIVNLRDKLGLGDAWKIETDEKGSDIYLDNEKLAKNESAGTDVIEISDANQLMQISAQIAGGDTDAATANYKLACDINLHGKKWLPMGLSQENAFSGTFDGAGYTISNFQVNSKKLDVAGFFGYIKGGNVLNLNLDCVVNTKNSTATGSLAGINDSGLIKNCHVRAKVASEKSFGGFVGRNIGTIIESGFVGSVSHVIPPSMIIIPIVAGVLAILSIGSGVAIHNFVKAPYTPEIIDPNQKPIKPDGPNVPPPPPGSNRISFELNQEVYVNVNTGVGQIDYVNPHRSTQDVVISVRISDKELLEKIGRTGRTAKEQAELEADPEYDPAKHYHELYRSGRLQIGYKLEYMKLAKLADGTSLPVGDYEMTVAIDAYNPKTQEKAVVSAQAPVTVHIVEPKKD